jgi:hypothetical protein
MLSCAPWATTDYGRITVRTTTDLPTETEIGMMAYVTDTDQLLQFVGSKQKGPWDGSAAITYGQWMVVAEPKQTYAPTTLYSGVTVGNGTTVAFYKRSSGYCDLTLRFAFGSTSAVTGPIGIVLPFELDPIFRPAVQDVMMFRAAVVQFFGGDARYSTTAGVTTAFLWAFNAAAAGAASLTITSSTVPFAVAWTTSDQFHFTFRYRMAYLVSY